jgi:hypothetical protein
MRIAHITSYQGPTLMKRRPIVGNRSMSNRIKIELIAQLPHANGHDVDVFSYGEVDNAECPFYPAFMEPEPFHPRILLHYISALPIRRVYGVWASLRMVALLNARHRVAPFDVVIIFNFKPLQIACARYAVRRRIPLILEYEDDAFGSVGPRVRNGVGDALPSTGVPQGAGRRLRLYRGADVSAVPGVRAAAHTRSTGNLTQVFTKSGQVRRSNRDLWVDSSAW